MLTPCTRRANVTGVALVGCINIPGREQIQMGRVELDSTELLTTSLSESESKHIFCNSASSSLIYNTHIIGWSGFLRNGDNQCTLTVAANVVLQRDETTMSTVSDGCASLTMACTLKANFLTHTFSVSRTLYG